MPKIVLRMLAVMIFFSAGAAGAAEKPRPGEEVLLDTYHRYMDSLESSSFGVPLFVVSFEQGDRVHVDVYGVFDYPFASVVNVLTVPANWCDILPLHPNVKACTYRAEPGASIVTLYLGRKEYLPPEDARQVMFHFRNAAHRHGYLDIVLSADGGPYGTKDHRLKVEARPLEGGRTFVHVSYAYSDSAALRFAAKVYFATLGRDKTGFSVTGTDSSGKPVHIGGPRGAIERNAVRCYFAIQAYMDALRYPAESRFSRRTSEWYDLTARYRKQLFDLEKKDYLTFKAQEKANQEKLQRRIGAGRGV